MVGAGAVPFAIMGYVIAHFQLDKTVGAQVRLNPALLAAVIGESEADIERGIKYLCAPDPKTTTQGDEGRRLVKLGQFDYRVVNGAKYTAIRNEEERREANRLAKQRQRAKSKPISGETTNEKLARNGGLAEADAAQDLQQNINAIDDL